MPEHIYISVHAFLTYETKFSDSLKRSQHIWLSRCHIEHFPAKMSKTDKKNWSAARISKTHKHPETHAHCEKQPP